MSARSGSETRFCTQAARRRWLAQAGALVSSAAFPFRIPTAVAQSQSTLNALPRISLVIGNSKYAEAPLRNPGNDAKAIAGELQKLGFQVNLKLDAGRSEMLEAIRGFGSELAKRKSVGLFYYAGHGAQLAWRNYLVPVDAEIDQLEDMRTKTIELNSLLQELVKARNPMNVIILDACRDNPFGAKVPPQQKGLSQFDAPPGSLLAYATAPGNTAADGEGVNGLYTGNLLRELKSPEAKIEDVFKRVRLNVRLKSGGRQIPWESTSLEEDFYFIPPRALVALAEAEAERERKREIALLEKRRAEEEAERKRKQEQALHEAKLAAEEAERKRQQELVALEQQRIAEEAERIRKRELALKEAQRVAEEAERKRREEQALLKAKLAQEEAERKYRQELALREKQRAEEAAERKRKEEQALRKAKLEEEEAERKYKQELALREKQRAQEEAERRLEHQPAPIGKPDARVAERRFEEELAIWEKIKSSTEPGPLEDYLRKYPSGRFSELAEFQLDRVLAKQGEKKIEVVSDAANPFSKGTARIDTKHQVGDSYSYREIDLYTKLEIRQFTNRVTEITDTEVRFNNGAVVTDAFGNLIRQADGRRYSPAQFFIAEYSVGKKWTSRYRTFLPNGDWSDIELELKVTRREQVAVPAGTFDAYRVESEGWGLQFGAQLKYVYWIAPQVKRPIARENFIRHKSGKVLSNERQELTVYSQQ